MLIFGACNAVDASEYIQFLPCSRISAEKVSLHIQFLWHMQGASWCTKMKKKISANACPIKRIFLRVIFLIANALNECIIHYQSLTVHVVKSPRNVTHFKIIFSSYSRLSCHLFKWCTYLSWNNCELILICMREINWQIIFLTFNFRFICLQFFIFKDVSKYLTLFHKLPSLRIYWKIINDMSENVQLLLLYEWKEFFEDLRDGGKLT